MPTIHSYLLLPVVLLAASHSFCQTNEKAATLVYAKDNYRVQYPKGWNVDTSGAGGAIFFLMAPLEGPNDKFRENFNLLIQDTGDSTMDLVKYKQISENGFAAYKCKVIESKVINDNNRPYYKGVYELVQGDFTLKCSGRCYIRNGKAYLLTFSAERDKYDQYRQIGEDMLASFTLTNN